MTPLPESFLAALRGALRADQLSLDEDTLRVYGHDESDTVDAPPQVLVFAESTTDVQAVMRAAYAAKVAVTPIGARTGKSGGSLSLQGGVGLSLERMKKVLRFEVADLTITVEPGLVLGELMKTVEAKGLFYPPDPNSWETCTIGGNVAENAGGPRALKYGVTKDYVLALTWVMPDGEVLKVGRQTIKGVAGYDLVGLLVGSEGTLGVATEITLQLIPLPRQVMTALLTFADVITAANALTAVLTAGILPRTLELLDEVAIRAVEKKGFTFPAGTGAAVIFEVDGNHADGLLAELAQASEIVTRRGALETLVAQDESQREKLWAARRMVSSALRALQKHKISEDICVPRSKIPEAIARFKAIGQQLGLTVATYGHAGDGNLHANVLYDTVADRPRVNLALDQLMRLTIELGGTITGEHGVGLAKRAYLPLEQSQNVIELQKRLKGIFDPQGLQNPGKIF